MEKYNVHFKKKFGQNFLKHHSIVERIVSTCSLTKNDLVIEIGPGGAILTKELSSHAGHVLAYEVDLDLKEELERKLSLCSNVTVLYQDFLKSDIIRDISSFDYEKIYFISNVPYYITTPIIIKLINSKICFEKICMMVQKEVGERFTAIPGNKNYSSITVFLNYFYEVKKEFLVSRSEFIPVPNVDSVVITFKKKDILPFVKNENLFFQLVRDSFQFRRKNIKNNLKKYNLSVVFSVLEKYGYDLSVRAEMLSIDIFIELANALDL